MSFKMMLDQLLADVPGSVGAILVDWEGEAVDQVAVADEEHLKLLGAHYGIVLNLMREQMTGLGVASPEQVIVRRRTGTTLMIPLNDEYLLILQLNKTALVARAVEKMRRCAQVLREEIVGD